MDDLLRKYLGVGGIPCAEVHKLLFDYAQGSLDPDLSHKLEEHIGDCSDCLDFVDTYRKTIRACHEHCRPRVEIPPQLAAKLREFIARELR